MPRIRRGPAFQRGLGTFRFEILPFILNVLTACNGPAHTSNTRLFRFLVWLGECTSPSWEFAE
jgi:hypothetical protein